MRLAEPRNPVTLHLDGRAVIAERGEPVAVALVAAGHLALARSPKFHRPRGPSCLRAACDGCLARVDGVPNVLTCRVPASEGIRVERQNVLGRGETDLLRAADWFFPEGMNHHEFLVGAARVPGVQRALQAMARRIAGLGRLPDDRSEGERDAPRAGIRGGARPASRRGTDVLVIGSGAAGMSAAVALAGRGRTVEVIDDALQWGGGARLLLGLGVRTWGPLCRAFADALSSGEISLHVRTTAAGIYADDVLALHEGDDPRVELLTARTLVLAPGSHDGVLLFEGNDLPGVMSSRAACWFASFGIRLGEHAVVLRPVGEEPSVFGQAYARAVPGVSTVAADPARVTGGHRAKELTIRRPDGESRLRCDTLVIDAPPVPAHELCEQAGAALRAAPGGAFLPRAPNGRIRDGVFVVGEAAGTPLEPAAVARETEVVVAAACD
ncbi:MAG: (2Fe-2S)-binding protein [Myxococcales bacterium]|nr:(2Fe-2S)-binding protein [Myxococcales bacterium]